MHFCAWPLSTREKTHFRSVMVFVQVQKKLFEAGFMVDTDLAPGDTLNKKIRNAQLEQYNYILG